MGRFFGQIVSNNSQNQFNNKTKIFTMETKQKYLVHLTFSVSLKNTPYNLQNFKSEDKGS